MTLLLALLAAVRSGRSRKPKPRAPNPRNAVWKCRDCLTPIVYATCDLLDGGVRKMLVNGDPHPRGRFEYVAGSTQRPRLRELDLHEQLHGTPDGDRFNRHDCRTTGGNQ